MNEYRFADLSVGMEISFDYLENGRHIIITTSSFEKFQELSGDISPIHLDEDYARRRGFCGRVCYGMLVPSFYSTLVGTYLPGRYALTVKELHAVLKRVTLKAHIRNQKGEIVSRATLEVGMSE